MCGLPGFVTSVKGVVGSMPSKVDWGVLTAAVEKIAAIELGQLEEAQSFSQVAPTCIEIRQAMQGLAEAVEKIENRYEEDLSISSGFTSNWEEGSDLEPQSTRPALRAIDRISANETGKQRVADLAWFALKTLRQKIASLDEAIQSADIWHAIGQCLSAKRIAIKTGTAIEKALSDELGVPSRLGRLYDTEIERSLRIRKLYVRFRSQMMPNRKPEFDEVEMRLRMVAVAFAKVFGERAYDDVRVQDKQLFRRLQGQVFGWMRSRIAKDPEATVRTGLRVWQEAAAFAECLMIVNNRTELRDHDRALAAELYDALSGLSPQPDHDYHRFWEQVKLLEGRDEDLDQMIADRVLPNDGRWLKVLARVAGITLPGAAASQDSDLSERREDAVSSAVQSNEW